MIESITLKEVATYDETGITISDLKKINFIYGANGSGKTTITKYLDNPENPNYASSSTKWKNELTYKTLIYNKDFRDRNFNKSNIDGVFTLGQATQEEIQAVNQKRQSLKELKSQLLQANDTLNSRMKTLNSEQDAFKEQVWKDIFKEYENDFKEAFIGFQRKEAFVGRVLREVDKPVQTDPS